MDERKRVGLLIAILVLVVAVAGSVATALLYRTAVQEQRARLSEMAQSQARLIEAIAANETAEAGGMSPHAGVLAQVQAAHRKFDIASQTTEIAIARRQDDQIFYLMRHRNDTAEASPSLPLNTPLAEPMRRALAGESGTTIGLDYRGQTVLAAYEPISVLGWGVVVKRDISEIRAPFWRAGLLAGMCAIGAIALGAWAFVAVTAPLLQHLRDSEDRLRRAVIHAPFPMMIHAEDGQVLLTSNAWNHISGYAPEEIATIPAWVERAYGSQLETHRQRLTRLYAAEGPVAEGEREIRTANGVKRIWDFSSAPLGRSDQGTRLAISMAMDVTERKEAEQALAIEKEQLRVTLRSIGDAVITTGVDGAVAMMNPVAEALTGWPLEDARGKPLTQVFHIINETTRQVCENPVEKVLQTGRVSGLANHTALIARDGSERVIADSGAPIVNVGGGITGVVLVFRDNTETDRVHKALAEAREHAEAASRAKDRFLAALSHELRTPLTPVLVMISMLQNDARASAVREDLAVIRRGIELEARLIDDLLDLTRIVQGKMKMELQVVNVHEVLSEALEIARGGSEAHRLDIRCEAPTQPCMVRADAARLQQVFWNIVRNAMQYTPDGGELVIRTSRVDDAHCEVTFADNGIGIDREFLPRIFDAFEQGDIGALRRPGGLGLGLAICRSIMQHLGGSIDVHSEGQNRGATFTVRLPLIAPALTPALQPEPAAPVAAAPESAGRLQILLVEDHAMTLKVMARLLRGMGHEVAPAATVKAALDLAASRSFDLLVSDIGLPDGSGLDVMRWFAQNRPICGIALSGFGMDADIENSLQAGFVTHLTKPVSPEVLMRTIGRVVTRTVQTVSAGAAECL